MNSLLRSTARSLDVQPIRSGGAAIEFKELSTQRNSLAQTLPRKIARAASTTLGTIEQSVFQKINQYRQQKGLSLLTRNSTINQQARQHSQTMASTRVLSHDGFNTRVQTISKTIRLRSAAENVAYNWGFSDPAAQAVNGWLNSPGHLQNIMGNYDLTGVGVAKNTRGEYYFTQIFIKRA